MKLYLLNFLLVLLGLAFAKKTCISNHATLPMKGGEIASYVPDSSKFVAPYLQTARIQRPLTDHPLSHEEERKVFEKEEQKSYLMVYMSIFGGAFAILGMVTVWYIIQKCKKCVTKLSTPTMTGDIEEQYRPDELENKESDDQGHQENIQLADEEIQENKEQDDQNVKELGDKITQDSIMQDDQTIQEPKIQNDQTIIVIEFDSKMDGENVQDPKKIGEKNPEVKDDPEMNDQEIEAIQVDPEMEDQELEAIIGDPERDDQGVEVDPEMMYDQEIEAIQIDPEMYDEEIEVIQFDPKIDAEITEGIASNDAEESMESDDEESINCDDETDETSEDEETQMEEKPMQYAFHTEFEGLEKESLGSEDNESLGYQDNENSEESQDIQKNPGLQQEDCEEDGVLLESIVII